MKTYTEETKPDKDTLDAIRLFHEIAQGANASGWRAAFLSGFAIDAHFGYLTRNHGDVDIMIPEAEAPQLATLLDSFGHTVYEPEALRGECLKVDQIDPEKPLGAHADIHYFHEEDGKVVIPLFGRKLVFSGSFGEITEIRDFLSESVRVLKPDYLLEEKRGWEQQVGLKNDTEERRKKSESDIEKIAFLIKNGITHSISDSVRVRCAEGRI